jgi:hypothetical protein
MKTRLIIPALGIAFIIAFGGCGRTGSAGVSSPQIVATDSDGIKALAKLQAQQLYRTRLDPQAGNIDAVYFIDKNRDEIVSTFQVAEVIQLTNSAVALSRFSIGGTIYHKSIWFTKLDGRWFIALHQFVDEYNMGHLKTEDPDKAKDVIQKASAWKKDGADLWFWEY